MSHADQPLTPLLRDRLLAHSTFTPRQRIAARRWLAAMLAAAALAIAATSPSDSGSPVVVAASDLPSGHQLTPADISIARVDSSSLPREALSAPEAAEGRLLVGPVRAGEILTDARVLTPRHSRDGTRAVPVRLAEPDIALLLHEGDRVDVFAADPYSGAADLLAAGATVLVVARNTEKTGQGPVVLLALDHGAAARVAAASLERAVAVVVH